MPYYDWSKPKNKMAKLKIYEVKEIREKYKTGKYTYEQLALEYKITANAIMKLIKGYTWSGV